MLVLLAILLLQDFGCRNYLLVWSTLFLPHRPLNSLLLWPIVIGL
jgi:hypothetical protein